jgi:hypothetical protein
MDPMQQGQMNPQQQALLMALMNQPPSNMATQMPGATAGGMGQNMNNMMNMPMGNGMQQMPGGGGMSPYMGMLNASPQGY